MDNPAKEKASYEAMKKANMPQPSTEKPMPLQPLTPFGKNPEGKEILPR